VAADAGFSFNQVDMFSRISDAQGGFDAGSEPPYPPCPLDGSRKS